MVKSHERYIKDNQNEIIIDLKTKIVKGQNIALTAEGEWRASRIKQNSRDDNSVEQSDKEEDRGDTPWLKREKQLIATPQPDKASIISPIPIKTLIIIPQRQMQEPLIAPIHPIKIDLAIPIIDPLVPNEDSAHIKHPIKNNPIKMQIVWNKTTIKR